MKNNWLDPGFCRILSFLTIALVLTTAVGCSSGTQKSTKSTRKEAPSPQASERSRVSESPTPPVVSETLEQKPKKIPSSSATSTPEPSRSAPMASAPSNSESRQRRTYKKRKTQPPKEDNSLDALLGTTPTMTAQESSSGSSIRGLSPVSENYGKDHKIPEDILDSVRRMEEFEISDDEIERFQKAGKLK